MRARLLKLLAATQYGKQNIELLDRADNISYSSSNLARGSTTTDKNAYASGEACALRPEAGIRDHSCDRCRIKHCRGTSSIMSSVEPLLSKKSKRYHYDTFVYSMTLPTRLIIGMHGFQIVLAFFFGPTDCHGTFRIEPTPDASHSCTFEPLGAPRYSL